MCSLIRCVTFCFSKGGLALLPLLLSSAGVRAEVWMSCRRNTKVALHICLLSKENGGGRGVKPFTSTCQRTGLRSTAGRQTARVQWGICRWRWWWRGGEDVRERPIQPTVNEYRRCSVTRPGGKERACSIKFLTPFVVHSKHTKYYKYI